MTPRSKRWVIAVVVAILAVIGATALYAEHALTPSVDPQPSESVKPALNASNTAPVLEVFCYPAFGSSSMRYTTDTATVQEAHALAENLTYRPWEGYDEWSAAKKEASGGYAASYTVYENGAPATETLMSYHEYQGDDAPPSGYYVMRADGAYLVESDTADIDAFLSACTSEARAQTGIDQASPSTPATERIWLFENELEAS